MSIRTIRTLVFASSLALSACAEGELPQRVAEMPSQPAHQLSEESVEVEVGDSRLQIVQYIDDDLYLTHLTHDTGSTSAELTVMGDLVTAEGSTNAGDAVRLFLMNAGPELMSALARQDLRFDVAATNADALLSLDPSAQERAASLLGGGLCQTLEACATPADSPDELDHGPLALL